MNYNLTGSEIGLVDIIAGEQIGHIGSQHDPIRRFTANDADPHIFKGILDGNAAQILELPVVKTQGHCIQVTVGDFADDNAIREAAQLIFPLQPRIE